MEHFGLKMVYRSKYLAELLRFLIRTALKKLYKYLHTFRETRVLKGCNNKAKRRDKYTMENLIQTLLDGYETPVFLSDADGGKIMFVNDAAEQTLGFSEAKMKGIRVADLLEQDTLIWHQQLLKFEDHFYQVRNEKFTFSGTKFVKYTLKPFSKQAALSYFNLQQEMASRIVHRLRSPLAGSLGFAKLLGNTTLDDQQLKYVGAVEDGLSDLESVLAQLKVLGEEISAQKEKVDARLLAEQVIEALPSEQAARISLVIDEQKPEIETSFILLKSIIEEMLVNAFQHGAGCDAPVGIHFMNDRIRISNEGEPIPESLAPYIFYPFFSSKSRTMGIGLAKCAHYANELDMNLHLAKNSGQEGISFDILFNDSPACA